VSEFLDIGIVRELATLLLLTIVQFRNSAFLFGEIKGLKLLMTKSRLLRLEKELIIFKILYITPVTPRAYLSSVSHSWRGRFAPVERLGSTP
jgi:hypothetical protein